MFFVARRAVLSSPRPSHLQRATRTDITRRTFVSSAVDSVADGFLDLATALPLPSAFPPYSTTIILVTVVSRLVFTLPFSLWVRMFTLNGKFMLRILLQAQQRRWRLQDVVTPALKKMVPKVQAEVIEDIKKEGHFIVPKDTFKNPEKKAQLNAKINHMVKERTSKIVRGLFYAILSYADQHPRSTLLRNAC